MSLSGFMFGMMAGKSDKKRDASLVFPSEVEAIRDINYAGNNDIYNNLDVYFPKGTTGVLPVIVSYHGGGYVYGTKEIYQHYGAYLASKGFVFVNFNYHLAPKYKYPTQLTEANMVFKWVEVNAEQYHMDIKNIFVVGDSAGAQMISQYLAIFKNEEYAKLFPFEVPQDLRIRAAGLNCGLYSVPTGDGESLDRFTRDLMRDYMGNDIAKYAEMNDVLGNIKSNYPPCYIMTSEYDFLKANAKPMCEFLQSKGVEAQWKCYGTPDKKYMGHVCHVNMNLEEAREINDDEVAFFRAHMVE